LLIAHLEGILVRKSALIQRKMNLTE